MAPWSSLHSQSPPAAAALRLRKNASLLSAEELDRFRTAMDKFMRRQDNEGYSFFAGWHGIPLGICKHHEPLFLPWHRGYLLHFELALQRFDPEVTLPWWDWLNEAEIPPRTPTRPSTVSRTCWPRRRSARWEFRRTTTGPR